MSEIKSKKYAGVFYRELSNGDRSYFLRIRINGEVKRFKIGKKSEGITEAFCNQEKIRIINESKFDKETAMKLQKKKFVNPSFSEMVDYYVSTSTAAPNTKRETSYLKNTKLAEITHPNKLDIQQFLIERMNEVKPSTANLLLKRIRAIYRHCIMFEFYRGEDPTQYIKSISGEQVRRRTLNQVEIEMLLDALKDKPRHYLFVKIALCTGARKGSILRMHKNDIADDGSVSIYNEKKNRSYTGFLDAETMGLLKNKKGYVLALEGEEDKPASRGGLTETIQKVMDKLFNPKGIDPLDRVVIHTLRHSVATQMVNKGIPIEVISKTLDHTNIGTTAKFYAKISDDVVRKSVTDIWK